MTLLTGDTTGLTGAGEATEPPGRGLIDLDVIPVVRPPLRLEKKPAALSGPLTVRAQLLHHAAAVAAS